MSTTATPRRLGASELTQKFRKQTDDLVIASSPRNPWIQLLPQKPLSSKTLKIPSILEGTDAQKVKELGVMSPVEKVVVDKKQSDTPLPSFSADSFLKLHALCSSSSSSLEMIRM
jgi:hypothetical protein